MDIEKIYFHNQRINLITEGEENMEITIFVI